MTLREETVGRATRIGLDATPSRESIRDRRRQEHLHREAPAARPRS
ncbi:hypothetical protein [Micromonospora marina]